jgi:hypothetical protein
MFEVHRLNETGMQKAHDIGWAFQELSTALNRICGPDGREMAIARTKLEEACFFAKKAMAQLPENHVADQVAPEP